MTNLKDRLFIIQPGTYITAFAYFENGKLKCHNSIRLNKAIDKDGRVMSIDKRFSKIVPWIYREAMKLRPACVLIEQGDLIDKIDLPAYMRLVEQIKNILVGSCNAIYYVSNKNAMTALSTALQSNISNREAVFAFYKNKNIIGGQLQTNCDAAMAVLLGEEFYNNADKHTPFWVADGTAYGALND